MASNTTEEQREYIRIPREKDYKCFLCDLFHYTCDILQELPVNGSFAEPQRGAKNSNEKERIHEAGATTGELRVRAIIE